MKFVHEKFKKTHNHIFWELKFNEDSVVTESEICNPLQLSTTLVTCLWGCSFHRRVVFFDFTRFCLRKDMKTHVFPSSSEMDFPLKLSLSLATSIREKAKFATPYNTNFIKMVVRVQQNSTKVTKDALTLAITNQTVPLVSDSEPNSSPR